jgi:superfamily II DNA or RNA helicase
MIEYKNILTELIKDKASWRELKPELSKYNVHSTESTEKDTRAGKIFEVFTKLYFLVSPTEKDNFKNVWLFEETPLEVRNKLNLGNQDYGVDLVLQDIEDQYFVVQCKYKNDESSKLNWSADKIANLFAYCPNANGYIVFSNAVDLDNVSKTRHDNFTFYGVANLNEIEKVTFNSIYSLLAQNQLVERKLYDPLPHQEIAINECTQWFTEGEESRGQLILPCGAGKTFTALWIKERLKSKNTLVLVPSLALLRQIKNEWSKQRKYVYQYLCVCSETDIDKDTTDTLVTHTYEIDARVTTDSEHVKSFLLKPFDEKVIFSTYHSLQVIADAIKEINFKFDFTFCDEAHKTAGVGNGKFSLVHNNNRIPSKYRLYATATPRIVKESLKKKLGDDLKYAYDMNDPDTFGYEFHRMTFKDAIEEEILVDYKIVAIGVNSDELKEYIEQRRFVDKNISIDELANNYALEHVMKKYNANHGLTFHSRVKLAQEFANRHSQLFPNTKTFSVSGEQPTSYRNLVLEDFKSSEKAIVSNARCLTEGVDVPTIDLVYFCDPKNSKVDIVQAVGRALRKKEGKKLGLIVVPIYHSKKDEVENSISSGSFKNLLQVIRSLCDQDERLQDEINFIAFGKGKRKSNKIEIISSSFIEEQDKIILEGFEEKLRNSLFDQIIEKSSNNWDLWFLNLKNFLESNNQEYPSKKNDKDLYNWIANQRNRKENGTIKNEELRKLNSINFVWDIVELKWYKRFEALLNYRKTNSNSWPQYDRKNPESEESKLSVFCQVIRKRYREGNLANYWFDKMHSIDFNFEGKTDHWTDYWKSIKDLLESKKTVSVNEIGENAYSWILRHKKKYDNGELNEYESKKIEELNLDQFFETWEQTFDKIKDWIVTNGKLPTKVTQKNFHSWLGSQRSRYKNERLSDEQIKALQSIGYDLDAKGKEKESERWIEMFENVKSFKTKNGVWPKFGAEGFEGKMYNWCQAQRQAQAGTASGGRRKPLQQWQIDKLESIGFHWAKADVNDEQWEQNFNEFRKHVDSNGNLSLPSIINGEHNLLYRWFFNQRIAFQDNKIPKERLERFREIGIDLNKFENETGRDGFTKWANKTREIADFIKQNGAYPKAGKDKTQSNLYQSLARTKRAYVNNQLSERQLELLNELNIKLN